MRKRQAILAGLVVLGTGGCGTGLLHRNGRSRSASPVALPPVAAMIDPSPTGRPADPAAVKVIKAWSGSLREGDVVGAARLFALPSEFVNGAGVAPVLVIRTFAQAVAVSETLPCGARFLSADQRGRYVNALFRLTARSGPGGSDCAGGAGATARTNFLIVGGRIVAWVRAPDDPGDNPSVPAPAPPSAPAPGQSAPLV